MSQNTILITGATGFLGSGILEELVKENYKPIVAKRSFSDLFRINHSLEKCKFYDVDKVALKDIFEENHIKTILHCATNYGRGGESSFDMVNANLVFPLELLCLGIEHGVENFINTDTIIDKNINYYSLSKRHFQEWIKVYSSDLKIINISLEHFYGACDNRTKFTSWVVDGLLQGVPSMEFTEGFQKRDFIYIDDVISAFMTIIKKLDDLPDGYNHFEVGTGNTVSIKEFVFLCKELTKNTETKLNFGTIPMRENETLEYLVDTTELKKLGWDAKYSLEDGLKLMIEKIRLERGG